MLDRWYEQHNAELKRFIRSKGFTPEDTEDLCAQIFFEAVRRQPADIAPRAWLFQATRFRMIDIWKRPRIQFIPLDMVTESAVAPDDSGELHDALYTALSALTPPQRHTIIARYIRGLSLGEVAVEMGISHGAVKALQHRGLERLRKQCDWNVFL